MKIKLLVVGKTIDSSVKELINLYEKRVNHYLHFEIIILENNVSKTDQPQKQKEKECASILKKIDPKDFVVLLDENGKTFHSLGFSQEIEKWMNQSVKTVSFVIGGAYGFTEEVYQRANQKISLSPMTFSHQIIRIIFMEQLYRAFTILNNEPYHHA